jgi:hypothetical protein
MRRLPLLALPLALPLLALAPSTAAAATGCTKPQLTTGTGLAIVGLKSTGTTCATARAVAKRATASKRGDIRSTVTADGRRWRCKLVKAATGTTPGYDSRSTIRCTSGNRVVRFQLAS